MRKFLVLFLALAFVVGFSSVSFAEIVGSDHDFSTQPWSGGQICLPCHAPHNVATPVIPPLWNHEVTTATYAVYSSPTLDAGPLGQPDGSTLLCLSCHDGTVAVDSFGGATGTFFITGDENLGTDLTNDHPISFTYDTALAATDGGLWDPATRNVTIGSGNFTQTGTIQDVMLQADQLQCAACHDVHNDFVAGGIGGDPLLKISKQSSAICLACHNK
jgi:nitrate reductase cytochrome c-type subunit